MEFIFNEWFIEYMVPGSGHEEIVWKLLDRIEAKGDRLVVRRESPLTTKLYTFSKLYSTHVETRDCPDFR